MKPSTDLFSVNAIVETVREGEENPGKERPSVPYDFDTWRARARALLQSGVAPADAHWHTDSLFSSPIPSTATNRSPQTFHVPPAFISMAQRVACARYDEKWDLLYRILWRLNHGQRHLLQIAVDDDVHLLNSLAKAVRRDVHKMKAFVRFRKMEDHGQEHFVAWHRPDHLIVALVAPFFVDRFAPMRWTILTPDASVSWDLQKISFGPGVARREAPSADALEDCWRDYYGAIFNPARIKLKAMRKEMPVRHWATLPEADIIDKLLRQAPARVNLMRKTVRQMPPASAEPFIPRSRSLDVLASAARACRGCALHCNATQTVFGEGPASALCMVIGEQPGEQEDLAGRAFVGPAGQVLNDALQQVGIDRSRLYVTNAVKHFKFEQRGKRRIHAKPSAREVGACRPWLLAEIEALQPRMILCLGATAAQSLLGAGFRLHQNRGLVQTQTSFSPWLMATIHPSFLLRINDRVQRKQMHDGFLADLRSVAEALVAIR